MAGTTSSPESMAFKPVPLFGGAITADIPAGWEDVSRIRQVPDTQEVFLDANGFSSLVFDILERVSPPQIPASSTASSSEEDIEALKFHLSDLIDSDVDAHASVVLETAHAVALAKMPDVPCLSLTAKVPAGEKQRGRRNEPLGGVVLVVVLVRLERVETDLVVVVNLPVMAVGGEEGVGEMGRHVKERVAETLEVRDWGLFGEE